jgi:uncharacterized membrane protein YoaK (UPF0700 family)
MPEKINYLLPIKLLPAALSLIAGSVDVISFLGLNGLFLSHITGNLVILAVRIVNGAEAPIALILSVPVFILVLGLTRLFVYGLDSLGRPSLLPLLFLQFLLLTGFLLLCVSVGAHIDPNTLIAIIAGMLGVSAMAVQNALVQLSLQGAPPTAVMTSNVTRVVMDLGEIFLGRDAEEIHQARARVQYTWPAIAGFIIGCGLGAWGEAQFGLWALILPAFLALIALLIAIIPCGRLKSW